MHFEKLSHNSRSDMDWMGWFLKGHCAWMLVALHFHLNGCDLEGCGKSQHPGPYKATRFRMLIHNCLLRREAHQKIVQSHGFTIGGFEEKVNGAISTALASQSASMSAMLKLCLANSVGQPTQCSKCIFWFRKLDSIMGQYLDLGLGLGRNACRLSSVLNQ